MRTCDINTKLLGTETIPTEVYQNMPALIAEPCIKFQSQRHKDVLLTSNLGVLSACTPGVFGRYFKLKLYPHMYIAISAPAASGKGTAIFARKLATPLHEARKHASPPNEGDSANYVSPLEYRKWGLFLAANTSASMFIHQLYQNKGEGIFFESEIDTMLKAMNQDWGNYDSTWREASQHERIMFSRLTDNISLEINSPKLASVLTGTPDQCMRLFQSVENGSFSRNIFYIYKEEMDSIDVKPPAGGEDLDAYFFSKGEEVKNMAAFLETYPCEFKLSDAQWNDFNVFLNHIRDEATASHGEDSHSSSLRLGIKMFRIAMIISAVRKWENRNKDTELYCTERDFETAKALARVYMNHTLTMLEILPKSGVAEHLKSKDRFFQQLPESFSRAHALICGKSLKVSDVTIDRYLKQFVDANKLQKSEYNQYIKLQVA